MMRVDCTKLVLKVARSMLQVALGGLINHTLLALLPCHVDLSYTRLVAHPLVLFDLVKAADRASMTTLPDKVKDAHSRGVV